MTACLSVEHNNLDCLLAWLRDESFGPARWCENCRSRYAALLREQLREEEP